MFLKKLAKQWADVPGMRKIMSDIDVVIAWVDGNDREWQNEKEKYAPPFEREASSNIRYREWDNLHYIFRGIEIFMPWVRTVHFVTWGHVPKWLNTACPKLHVVKHQDFIPKEYLPTFNANAIELNFHRIPNLAEQFIYFNDDMFVVRKTEAEDFFKDGLPRDMACISPQPIYRNSIMNIELNNLKIINDYFTRDDIKKNKRKWMKPGLYGQYALRTLLFLQFKSIIGIFQPHVPYTLLKSTYATLWDKEFKILDDTCKRKYRDMADNNVWLMRSWQLVSGSFIPRSRKFGQLISASDLEGVKHFLHHEKKCHLVCINDDDTVENYEETKNKVNNELERILPNKSSFEK